MAYKGNETRAVDGGSPTEMNEGHIGVCWREKKNMMTKYADFLCQEA